MGRKHKELVALSGTLTTSEKGYFTKSANAIPVGNSGQSMALFQHILRAERDGTDASAPPCQSHRVSNYLYHSLLRSLENYMRKKTIADQVIVLCRQAKVVADRALFGQSQQLLTKAAHLCAKAGRLCLRPLVMHLQRADLLATGHHWGSRAMLQHAHEYSAMARTRFHGALAMEAHVRLAALHLHSGSALRPAQREHWQHTYNGLTSEIDPHSLDSEGRAHLRMAQALLARCTGHWPEAINTLQCLLHAMRHDAAPPLGPIAIAQASLWLHGLCLHSGRHPEAEGETAALQAWALHHLPAFVPHERTTLDNALQLQHLALHTYGPAHLRDQDAWLRAHAHLSGRALCAAMAAQFHVTAMAHHLQHQEHRLALAHFNTLMNTAEARHHDRTLTIAAELMLLAIRHGLDHGELLESAVRSLRKRLWNKTGTMPLKGMVRLLTHHYAKCPDVQSGKDYTLWKQKLCKALIAYREQEPEGYAEARFDWEGHVGA
ncbi:MAG: hypothetical protein K9J06_03770 [Flavobacteriales bacterium]|nr:hypothetical protein [Flavobacteriales bacterium]